MSVRFFGQFVVQEGVVTDKQLQDSLELMYWVNRSIGELATASGYMTHDEVERIRRAQLGADARFGQLAVDAGYLDTEQVEELLARQRSRQLRLGDALVELGFATEERLAGLLARFDAEQAPWAIDARDLLAPLAGWPLAQAMLGRVARSALRLGRQAIRFGEVTRWPGESGAVEEAIDAAQAIGCDEPLHVGLRAAGGFARALRSETRPEPIDGLHGLLQSLARQATAPESPEMRPLDTLPERGVAYEIVSVEGRALLIFGERPVPPDAS